MYVMCVDNSDVFSSYEYNSFSLYLLFCEVLSEVVLYLKTEIFMEFTGICLSCP